MISPTLEHQTYFQYLLRRSWTGSLYRNFFLYPRLSRHLPGRVLDIGCGLGDFLKFRPNTVGADINPLTIDYCRQRGLESHFIEKPPWPFETASFDGAVLDNVLEHLTDPKPLIAEIKRILKPQGRLLIGVPGQKGYTSDPDHKVYYDQSLLTQTLSKANFKPLSLFYTPIRLPYFDRRLRQYCLFGVFTPA